MARKGQTVSAGKNSLLQKQSWRVVEAGRRETGSVKKRCLAREGEVPL